MLEYEWHTGDNEHLAHLMGSGGWTLDREMFFFEALAPYYQAGVYYWDGIDRRTGDVLYRLSDLVDIEDRKRFAIYPSKKGSITLNLGSEDDPYESQWDSLEDWRLEWERTNPNIPDYGIVNQFIMEHLQKDPPAELKERQS